MTAAHLVCYLALIVHFALGTVSVAKKPRKRVNMIFAVLLFLFFLWALSELLLIHFGPGNTAVKLFFTPIILLPYVFWRFTAIFPQENPCALKLMKGWKNIAFAFPATMLLTILWMNKLISRFEPEKNGFAISLGSYEFLAKGVIVVYLLLALKNLSSSNRNLVSEYQIRRLRYTYAALILPAMAGSVYVALGRWYLSGQTVYTLGLFPALGIVMAAILAYAILKYQLVEIDVIFSMGLVYSILTAILAGIVEMLEEVFQNYLNLSDNYSNVFAVLIIAAVLSPLKDLLVKLINKMFGKQSFDPAVVIKHILESMRKAETPKEVLAQFIRESRPVLDFSNAVAVLRTGEYFAMKPQDLPLNDLPEELKDYESLEILVQDNSAETNPEYAKYERWFQSGFSDVYPICRNDLPEGMLFLAPKVGKIPYNEQERNLVVGLCNEIMPILDSMSLLNMALKKDRNLRELEWTREIYRSIQANADLKTFAGYEIRLFSRLAGEIKGDLVDLYDCGLSPFIAICDAFHHGIKSAMTLKIIFTAFRSSEPLCRMENVRRVLSEFAESGLGSAVTLIEPVKDHLRVTNAGNPPALLFAPDGSMVRLVSKGKPIGIIPVEMPETKIWKPCLDEFLLCMTNGLAKVFGDPDGEGLEKFLGSKNAVSLESVYETLVKHVSEALKNDFGDDVSFVLIGMKSK